MEVFQISRPTQDNNRVNQLGGRYTSGRPLSRDMRIRIIDLSRQGFRQCDISRCMKVTHGCISKLLAKYQETGMVESSQNVGRPRVITDEIERKVREYWAADPGMFCWEIRDRLLEEKVCQANDLPSLSSIGRLLKENMMNKPATEMTEKEEMVVEETSPETSYTRFTIANILGLESEDNEGASKKEESPEKLVGQKDALSLKRQTQRRERTRFTPIQVHELEREFRRNPYLVTQRRREISKKLNISSVTIQVWFANRRARGKNVPADLMQAPSAGHNTGKSLCLSRDKSLSAIGMPHRFVPRVYFRPIYHQRIFNGSMY